MVNKIIKHLVVDEIKHEIKKILKYFEEIFSYNYTSQEKEITKLIEFVNWVMKYE